MKNAFFAFTLLLSASPAFADRTYTLKEMIAEVHYQAHQCGNSAMKSKEMEEQDTDNSPRDIGDHLSDRQIACDLTESRRMLVFDRISQDPPKPIVKAGWFHDATSEKDAKISQAKAERDACIIAAIRTGIADNWAGDEKGIAREPEEIDACERVALRRLEVIEMLP